MKNKLYYKGELLTEISYQNGKIWVNNETINLKDWCVLLDDFGNLFGNPQQWLGDGVLNRNLRKIICQSTELNIEGVPYISFESNKVNFDEVFLEARKKYIEIVSRFYNSALTPLIKEVFNLCYQAHASTHSLSDDEVVEFARWMFLEDTSFTSEKYANFTDKDMLHHWKDQRSKDWEVELIFAPFEDENNPADMSFKKSKTYIKDGKEFLTIKLK